MGGSGGTASGSTDTGTTRPERPDKLHGRYAHGVDPMQAMGLSLHPTAMIPRAVKGLNPSDPSYGMLADLPAAGMATLMGGNGNPSRFVNNLGRLYDRADATGWLPSTQRMTRNLAAGKGGLDTLFQGEKAGPHDTESYTQPGYTYGGEPLMLGEASTTMGGLLDASLVGEPLAFQQKYGSEGWGGFLVDKWGSKAMKRTPGKGKPVNDFVMRHLYAR